MESHLAVADEKMDKNLEIDLKIHLIVSVSFVINPVPVAMI